MVRYNGPTQEDSANKRAQMVLAIGTFQLKDYFADRKAAEDLGEGAWIKRAKDWWSGHGSKKLSWATLQLECGANGSVHIQWAGRMLSAGKRRQQWQDVIAKIGGDDGWSPSKVWVAKMRGTPTQAADYCDKDDETKIYNLGEYGTRPAGPGKRNDLHKFVELIDSGVPLATIALRPENMSTYVKHHAGFAKLAALKASSSFQNPRFERTTVWINGKSGHGKTVFASKMLQHMKLPWVDISTPTGGRPSYADGLTSMTKVVWLDELRFAVGTQEGFALPFVLNMTGDDRRRLDCRGEHTAHEAPIVIVSTLDSIDDIYMQGDGLGGIDAAREQLRRRISFEVKCTKIDETTFGFDCIEHQRAHGPMLDKVRAAIEWAMSADSVGAIKTMNKRNEVIEIESSDDDSTAGGAAKRRDILADSDEEIEIDSDEEDEFDSEVCEPTQLLTPDESPYGDSPGSSGPGHLDDAQRASPSVCSGCDLADCE